MKGRLIDLSVSLDGKQRITIELDGDFRSTWDDLHDTDCEVSVKKFRVKRSSEANAYCWVLIDRIAQKMRMSKTAVYRNAIRDIGGVSDIVSIKKTAVGRLQAEWSSRGIGWQVQDIGSRIPGWTNVILYYGSSSYDTRQMSDLIDSLVQEAQNLGIETKSPEEIQSLLKEYRNVK